MTKTSIRLLFATALLIAACGGDDSGTTDSSIMVDGSADTGTGEGGVPDGGTIDATMGDGGTPDGAVADGGSGDGAAGCVGGTCPTGQECCSGVPYPPEGVCMDMCTMRSDRHAKESFEPVDGDEMLAGLADLPISEWRYRDDSEEVRHVGPMAQDFHARFGLGDDARVIHPVDATGVTIAAIQALARRVEDLERENAALREHTLTLEAQIRAQ